MHRCSIVKLGCHFHLSTCPLPPCNHTQNLRATLSPCNCQERERGAAVSGFVKDRGYITTKGIVIRRLSSKPYVGNFELRWSRCCLKQLWSRGSYHFVQPWHLGCTWCYGIAAVPDVQMATMSSSGINSYTNFFLARKSMPLVKRDVAPFHTWVMYVLAWNYSRR